MDRAALRRLPWPELTLIAFGVLFLFAVMVRSSTHSCHEWKMRLTNVSGAFLAGAQEENHPQPERGVEQERAELQNAARRLLAERPFACL